MTAAPPPVRDFSFTVPADAKGVRLDKFLADAEPTLSRTRIKALILAGQLQIDDTVTPDPSFLLKPGQKLSLRVPPAIDDTPRPQDIPLNIVFEDSDLLVIDKPAGMVVHTGAGHVDDTLVNALLHHCGDSLSGIGGVKRPGIVHRLDKNTSGLLMVAKNDFAHQSLSAQLADRSLSRSYKAVVWGTPMPPQGTIEGDIGRHPIHRQKMAVVTRDGRPALTQYALEKPLGPAALVICRLKTGRTHQIRVHMAHRGHPLLGDTLYGLAATGQTSRLKKSALSPAAQVRVLAFPRQALHAAKIRFIHPRSAEALTFESDLPSDIADLISILNQ